VQDPTGISMQNSEYVCGIPVTDDLTRNKLYMRVRFHPKSSGHILACSYKGTLNADGLKISLPEIGEHEAINIKEAKLINYIEKRLKQRFGWLQLSEGKIFCKVRNMLMLS